MKNILKKYDAEDTVLVISSFPNPENGEYGRREFNAIGEHSERRLPFIAKSKKVLVVAEDLNTRKYFSPIPNLLISRVWKKGNPLSFIKMFLFINKLKSVETILVQFEFNVWGGIICSIALLITLALLRLTGKKVIFEMHQVITDIEKLKKHINITNPLLQKIYNLGLKSYYFATGLVANKIIVFEEELKERIINYVAKEKVEVLALSVDKQKTTDKKIARKKLGLNNKEFILLVFGYINGYKGIDWITNALSNTTDKNIRLLIAGGENPYLKDKLHYQNFYKKIVSNINKHKHMTQTGFIPDDKVSLYYSAADLAVMPYEVFMSASGPFSRALAHSTPIILSEKLLNYSKSDDFSISLKNSGLKTDDLFFKLNKNNLIEKISLAQSSPKYLNSLKQFTLELGSMRSSEKINEKYLDLLNTSPIPLISKKAEVLVQS